MECNVRIVACPVLHSTIFRRCRSKPTAQCMIIDSVSCIKRCFQCGNSKHKVIVPTFMIMHGDLRTRGQSRGQANASYVHLHCHTIPNYTRHMQLWSFSQIRQTFPRSGDVSSFKWKDYCPLIFRRLRSIFGIDDADYMLSLTGDS